MKPSQSSRRQFLQTSAVASLAVATPLTAFGNVHSFPTDDTIRIGLVGCGGRGTNAVSNAINSSPNVKIVAMADLAQDQLDSSRASLEKSWKEKGNYDVPDENCFVGIDAYKKVCAHPDVDIVIHTTPPGLRHLTLREAVENEKHSFVEKPVCVDAYSYRHVLESGKIADAKGVAIVSGTQYRREISYTAAIEQLHGGVIGDLTAAHAYYCTGLLWLRGDAEKWKAWGGIQGTEYQMRNWLYFNWLSGDHIAEQAIHNIDAINWAMGTPPESAYGNGGRQARTDANYGNIYDHFSIDYDYPGGVRVNFKCRQMKGAQGRVTNRFIGTKGTMDVRPSPGHTSAVARDFDGKVLWNHNGRENNLPYEQEHHDLIASIRDGHPIQEIEGVANSSLTTIIGREAAYSGQEVKFAWAQTESQLRLSPESFEDTTDVRPVPQPATYQLV